MEKNSIANPWSLKRQFLKPNRVPLNTQIHWAQYPTELINGAQSIRKSMATYSRFLSSVVMRRKSNLSHRLSIQF